MRTKVTILIFLLILVVPAMSLAQTGLGSITGHVSDKSGAAIPGAKVTVTNTASGISIDSVTNAVGIYLFQQLNPGQYRVEVVAPGFKAAVRNGLALDVDGNLGIDMKLEVGSTSETVTVTAAAPLLRTEDEQTGEVMNSAVIENFPNLNGAGEVRNVLGALQYAGDIQGANNSGGVAGANAGINHGEYSFSNLRVNGGRTSNTEYLVDGIPITQNMDRQLSQTVPTIEDTSEFKVVTNGMGAQYGHLSGGAIDMATQPGTKDLHGSFFDFLQSKVLNANSWDNNSTIINGQPTPKAGFHQDDFGIAIGGPVLLPHVYNGRQKTFWYFNYEGSRFGKGGGGNLVISSVLTAQERTGDVADMGSASNLPGCDGFGVGSSGPCNPNPPPHMYDPYQTSTYPNQVCLDGSGKVGKACTAGTGYQHLTLLPHNGTLIPSNYLSPIIQQYLKYLMPLPTPGLNPVPHTATGNNFAQSQNDTRSTDVYSIRIDEAFNDKSRMFARFAHNNATRTLSPSYGPNSPSTTTKTPNGFGATLNYDYTFSPTLLLNARVGGNYAPFASGSFDGPGINVNSFGLDSQTLGLVTLGGAVLPPLAGPWTEVNNTGANQNWGGNGTQGVNPGTSGLESTNYVYAVSLTKILGRHTLQFGYEGRRYYDNLQNSAEQTQSSAGQGFRFTSQSANQYSNENSQDDWSPQGYANGVGDFLMGLYAWGQNNSGFTNTLRQNYYAAYAQDDFKASPNLNLSLGLRWEMESPVSTNKNGTLTIWDADAPSPFTLASGWTWAGDVVAKLPSNLQGEVQEPDWAKAGKFPNGALEFVGTPQHPSMNANDWHPYNFSPRLGLALRVRKDMVIRSSGGIFFLPTGGSLNSYNETTGVAYTAQDGNLTHNIQTTGIDLFQTYETGKGLPSNLHPVNGDPNCGCIESPTPAGGFLPATQRTSNANLMLNSETANYGWAGAVDTKSHMPMEYNWSLGLQYEAKLGFLFEAVYNGNHSSDLLSKDDPGHFPAQLYTGGPGGDNQTIYANTTVQSPLAPTVPGPGGTLVLPGGYAGPTTAIGYLEYGTPYFGELEITNRNIGKSLYNALNLRVEHRMKDGFQILANYTISRSMDDVGGPEVSQGTPGTGGQGAKTPADYQSIRDVYGLSALDEPRRLTLFALYQLPVGRGRHYMNQHSTLSNSILDYVAGGWNVSGTFITTPGGPLIFTSASQASTDSGALHFHNVYGSYAPGANIHTLKNPHWGGPKESVYNGELQSPQVATPAFDFSQFVDAKSFTSTADTRTLPPIYDIIRNPDNWSSDISLSKDVPLFSADGARYLQIRMDATNWMNHPGLNGYDTNLGDGKAQFGTINHFGNQFNGERNIQLGARIVF